MFEGRLVNLRLAEKKDVPVVAVWYGKIEYHGEYEDVEMITIEELEKRMLQKTIFFIIEKKDRTKIGHISSWTRGRTREIGFALVPSERGKGYGRTDLLSGKVKIRFFNIIYSFLKS